MLPPLELIPRDQWRAAPIEGDNQHILLSAYQHSNIRYWLKVKLEAPLADLVTEEVARVNALLERKPAA
ncbi:MAG: hypothetical protein RJA36_319 [Pseudomonadota bacterium]|jgi:hypothetical protein